MTSLGDMIRRVCEDIRLEELFRGKSPSDIRALWDAFDPEAEWGVACGGYDPEDVRNYACLIGQGEYCAV